MSYKPVTLAIFDGLGVAPNSDGNAVTHSKMMNFQNYIKNYPVMTIFASGNEVGLLFGEMGNSEVGHLNIGAGRVYYQSCPRINNEINSGEFFKNPALLGAMEQVKKNKSNLHLIGLLGIGNVHASDSHLYALLDFCNQNKLGDKVFIHGILDGRDALYNSGKNFVQDLQEKMKTTNVGQLASLSGRFYAMDRDNRWDRCEKAYRAMALAQADRTSEDPIKIIDDSYAQKNYDEEFIPTVITKNGQPVAMIKEGDAVIFYNFRPDRARELTKAFVLPGFNKFERTYIQNLFFVTMTEFEKDLPAVVAYPPIVVHNSLAETVSKAGKKQFHVAETEKYAHVTFFLNGTVEDAFPGEDRAIIPSPRVSTYSEAPEMSANGVAKEAVKAIDSGKYDLIVLNFANPDMVGHTGNLEATIKGCEVADKAFGEVVAHTLAQGGAVVVTADHGNAEEVINLQTGEIDKEHSTNPVPLMIINKDFERQAGPAGEPPEGDLSLMNPVGVLADVAPTVLKLMGIEQPPEMTGSPLI